MKLNKFFVYLCVLFLFSNLSVLTADNKYINWEKSLEKAKLKSKQNNKPLFIMVTSKACPECRYMKKKVFKDKDIQATINKKYIPFLIQHRDKNMQDKFKDIPIPRFYFTDKNLDIYAKHIGGMRVSQMQKLLDKKLLDYKN